MPNTDLLLARTYDEDRERGLDRRAAIQRARESTALTSSSQEGNRMLRRLCAGVVRGGAPAHLALTVGRSVARVSRLGRGGIAALAITLLIAAPAAAATRPTRAVSYPTGFQWDAGLACAFPIAGVPVSGFKATTVFDDTHWMVSFRIKGYYENLVTHKTYWVNDTWSEKDVYDAATNTLTITGSGQLDVPFWPGDASPFGGAVVTEAAYYRFAGTTVNIIDFNGTPRTADFTWSGRITDICAALA